MAWTLVKGGTTVEVQNPVRDNLERLRKRQALSRSASGVPYVYDKGETQRVLSAEWRELRDSERDDLEAFFNAVVNAMEQTFTLTDHEGTAWTARFLSDSLDWRQVADTQDGAAGTFTSGGIAYPTTDRTSPVWALSVSLEVVAV